MIRVTAVALLALMFPCTETKALAVRGTAAQAAMAEQLVRERDLPR